MQKVKNLNFSFSYNHNSVVVLTRSGLALFLVVGLLGCSNLGYLGINAIGANITQIQDLKAQQEDGKTLYVQGKVEKRVPLLNRYAYQINDSTGKIWVVTNQTGLRQGSQVVIKGKVRYQSIPLGDKEYGEVYIDEE
jgi:ABC-type branched-subunit amino acid transport system permease subunit